MPPWHRHHRTQLFERLYRSDTSALHANPAPGRNPGLIPARPGCFDGQAVASITHRTRHVPPDPSPWRWIPSLYLLEGLPYAAVMSLSVVMYKNLGVSNTEIALYTSWLYLPWVLKALWSPLVDLVGTPRRWVLVLQFVLGIALALVAFTLPGPWPVRSSLALFWLMAFASATHDIAADGYYMQALTHKRQAAFVGVRSTAYRAAMISAQGGLVVLAGWLQERHGQPHLAWATVFGVLAAAFLVLAAYHLWALPVPAPAQAPPERTPVSV
ncbi:MAG: MFS transporter, partial [Ideonella sp.]|nr:MFS transporter [Ideonella sp.]